METVQIIEAEKVRANFYKAKKIKDNLEAGKDDTVVPVVPFEQLNKKQKFVIKYVRQFLLKSESDQRKTPLRMAIFGNAGTGKTLVLSHLKKLLQLKAKADPSFKFQILSFTGMASHNAGGTTIHSTFNLQTYRSLEDIESMLTDDIGIPLKEKLRGYSFFIIDEISTVGKLMFRYIEKCLREVNPPYQDKCWGSSSIILSGDQSQLPCIGDMPLPKPLDDSMAGRSQDTIAALKEATRLYCGIKKIVVLDETYRQSREHSDELHYLEFLDRLRTGSCTDADLEAVNARVRENVHEEELEEEFKDVVHLYPTRKMVRRRNSEALLELMKGREEEIIRVPNGLYPLEFAIGCKVVLRRNLCVPAGILNGSTGTVIDFYRPRGQRGGCEFILVDFKDYKGEVLVKTDRGEGLPIFRVPSSEQDKKTMLYVRSDRYELDLDYSTTVHRSQGQTYKKLCVFLGKEEMANGLTYTAFSRVSKWQDIVVLDEKVEMKRLVSNKIPAKNWRNYLAAEGERITKCQEEFLLQQGFI